jgi:maleylacetoacetate isomerase/maleylpyruvate isomerase
MIDALTLWGYWRSSTSYRIRIALGLKSLRHDYRPINLKLGEQKSEDYLAVNPHGTVPLFQAGDIQMTQSLAILDWLDATYPDPAFVPTDAPELCRDLYYAVATEIHAPNNLAVLKYLRTEFGADQAAIEAWYATWIAKTFAPVEARLAAHKWASPDLPFGQPTLFEIVLIPQVYNARRWKTDLLAYPLIAKIDAHCATLEAFDRARPENQIDAT